MKPRYNTPSRSSRRLGKTPVAARRAPTPRPAAETMSILPRDLTLDYITLRGNLAGWFDSRFMLDQVVEVLQLYEVGYDVESRRAIFWLIDHNNRLRSGKMIPYHTDGHRLKDAWPPVNWVHAYYSKSTGREFHYRACYFGSHLVNQPRFSRARILLVESEKTALYLAMELAELNALGRYLPLATGGSGGLGVDKNLVNDNTYRFAPLRDRDVVLLPDADATDKWIDCRRDLLPWVRSCKLYDLRSLATGDTDDILDILDRRRSVFLEAFEAADPLIDPVVNYPGVNG